MGKNNNDTAYPTVYRAIALDEEGLVVGQSDYDSLAEAARFAAGRNWDAVIEPASGKTLWRLGDPVPAGPDGDAPVHSGKVPDNIPVYSIADIIDAYRTYDASEEAKEPILYFISELTGKSVDALAEML